MRKPYFSPYKAAEARLREYQVLSLIDPDRLRKDCVWYSLEWYIKTGRACYEWIVAFVKATPKRLLAHVLKHSDGTVDANLKTAHAYLVRYCGLPYMPAE